MQDLDKKILELSSLYISNTEKDFIAGSGLNKLGLGVYTDKKFVYKFEPDTSEPEALERAKGINGAQQFVAYEKGVLVSEFVNKKKFVVGTDVPNKHLESLIETLLKLRKKNISFRDCHRKNLLYSKKEGFTLIDFCNEDEKLNDPFLPIHNLAFFMEEKRADEYFLKTYARLLKTLYHVEKKAFEKTLNYFINRDDIEYLFSFKKLGKNSCGYSQLRNIFELGGIRVDNISYNRYAGTFRIL
ncbi:hypothetical protein HZA97_10180 [Candidatus Woesearchaeota archaeon]|nr:hypothetical protein [Candidatus Woesearchaeota archaeon]